MSSLPGEVLRDALQPLDRWTLDTVQFTNRRFLQLIMQRMSAVCLREFSNGNFNASNENTEGSSYIRISNRPGLRELSNAHKDTAQLFSTFVHALRSSRVKTMAISGLTFTPELATLVLEAPIVANRLIFLACSFAELTPAQFHKVVLHFSPTTLFLNSCSLNSCQISDEFLGELCKNRVRWTSFPNRAPVDGGSFCVTDDAIVDFCVQPDVQIDREGSGAPSLYGELLLFNGSFTKDLFKRLVEASSASMRTQPLRIVVSPVRIEDEDLRDFAQHLSERYRGTPRHLRIYNFPGEQHGAVAGMHLQIVLHPDKRLELTRARRPYPFLFESGE